MAHDYAKSAAQKWSKKKGFVAQHKSRLILLLLLAAAFVFYRYSSIDFNQIKKGVSNTIEISQVRPKQLPKPKFEFYTRLPKGDLSQRHEPMSQNKRARLKKNNGSFEEKQNISPEHPTQTQHYLIQVAAFKQFSDADKLRAELIMQGHQASLSHYKNATTTWYRVEIGPFTSLIHAKAQQQALESSHHNGLIKKIG